MMAVDFDTSLPAILRCDAGQVLTMSDPIEFLTEYGDVLVNVTDADALVVKNGRLADLRVWWDEQDGPETQSASTLGHVVHWPIHRAASDWRLRTVIQAAMSFLTSCSPDLRCLLDRHPYDEVPCFSWTILGPKRTCVRVHQDMFGTASWNLMFWGRKKWRLWRPEVLPLDTVAPSVTFEQGPQELVWIPEKWWHEVRYDQSSICFSKNLILERSRLTVACEVERKEPRLTTILRAIAMMEKKNGHNHA